MSTFSELYESVERTFWNSLTKKLLSLLMLLVFNLGYFAIWSSQRSDVEQALPGPSHSNDMAFLKFAEKVVHVQ